MSANYAIVSEENIPLLHEVQKRIVAAVGDLPKGKRLEIRWCEHKPKRRLKQNALMWAWNEEVAQHTGYDKDVVHEYFVQRIIPKTAVESVGGGIIEMRKGTSELNIGEMAEYLTGMQRIAATDIGVQLNCVTEDDRHAMYGL